MNSLYLKISCTDLPSFDLFSKSDPVATIDEFCPAIKRFRRVGNTESIKNDNNPNFKKPIKISYFQGGIYEKWFRVKIYDRDSSSNLTKDHDYFGYADFKLSDIFSKTRKTILNSFNQPLKNVKGVDSLMAVSFEEYIPSKFRIEFQLKGKKLPKMDFFTSDPFFEIFRINENGKNDRVYCSEIVRNNLNPLWKTVSLNSLWLCKNDLNLKLLMKIYDFDDNSKNDFMGEFYFTVNELQNSPKFQLFKNAENPSKKIKGKIEVLNFKKTPIFDFSDYIRSNAFNTIFAFDFTTDNLKIGNQNSISFIYEEAFNHFSEIVRIFNSNKPFPIWGFGGKMGEIITNCFSLTHGSNETAAQSTINAISHLKQKFQTVPFGGPKIFAELIETALTFSRQNSAKNYFILIVLICDGEIKDEPKFSNLLNETKKEPFSVVFVGVGNGKFKYFKKEFLLNGKSGRKNTVFINFEKIKKNAKSCDPGHCLIEEVFYHIEKQSMEYFKLKNVQPLN